MSERKHPGTITYVDEENGIEWSKPAMDAPEGVRFNGDIPVVRVVRSAAGNLVEIHEFGPNGELLRTHTAFRDPPAEPKHPGTVTYVDEKKGTQWTKPAAELPARSRFEGGVPIVKVVLTAGEKLFFLEYGQNGELLRSTEGVRR